MRKAAGCALLCAMLSVAAFAANAQKQAYPNRPIRLIVPFAPGGGTDIMARMLAQRLSESLGSAIVIDNRPGGGGMVGTETTVRAAPDGYTMIFDAASYTTRAAMYPLTFDPIKDITPIALAFNSGYIVTLHPSVPIKTVKELIAYAQQHPDKLNYGSSGVGGFTHLGTELLLMTTGVRMHHVPYKGSGPAMNDLLGGQIQLMWGSLTAVVPHMKANRLRGIAVTTLKRWREMPELPAVSETVPGYESAVWYGVWGPRGLPPEIVSLWNREVNRIGQLPEMKERLANEGIDPVAITPDEFRRIIQNDLAKWGKVVKQGKLKPAQ